MNKPENNMVKIGEGMEFTSEYVQNFEMEYLCSTSGGVDEYKVGSIPDGYKQIDDLVYDAVNNRILGTYVTKSDRYGDIYLYREAFVSKEQLYLTLGHEHLHAAFWYNGMKHDPINKGVTPAHRSIYHWEYSQAMAWNYNTGYYRQTYGRYTVHPDFPYSKFSFTTIKPKVPW